MPKRQSHGRSKAGVELTDDVLNQMADEAEEGLDTTRLRRRPGRPAMGSGPAESFPVRLDPELRHALDELGFLGSPNGIRTRAATLRGWCPRPLDDGAVLRSGRQATDRRVQKHDDRPRWPVVESSGERTRTPKGRTRTCCVTNYTTPEGRDESSHAPLR